MTEINVTSPTGVREVKRFGGADIAALFWDCVEAQALNRNEENIRSAFATRLQLFQSAWLQIVPYLFLHWPKSCDYFASCGQNREGLTTLQVARAGAGDMVARVSTVAFQGIEAVPVDVQVMVAPGKTGMQIVGLADKAVAESRERVQAALHASGLSMPAKKVTVNLAPADLPKEGSHYDLAIALGLMAALGAIPGDALTPYVVVGELSLDGMIAAGRRLPSGRHRRQCARQGPDLPACLRTGSGLGGRDHRHSGARAA